MTPAHFAGLARVSGCVHRKDRYQFDSLSFDLFKRCDQQANVR
ncbi:MAG: hypothetical protein ONB11_06605 [candidate division KSB1 bacterium]|nr:hypothetical protein [candidate division KSB1 bacterium]